MLGIIQEASAAPLPEGWVEIEKDGKWPRNESAEL
jgi:hypothetical protein